MPSPRWRPVLSTVYRAETDGYLSLSFAGGRTDTVELYVGPEDPPTELVGTLAAGEIGAYFGGIVRKGEYWIALSKRAPQRTTGVRCLFTPID